MAHAPQDREVRFADLYRQTRDEVMAYLVRRTRSMEDAADALSETYAVAWRKLDSLPEGDRARLWLFGAARIELRKAAREGRAEDELITELAGELQAAHGEQIRSADADESLWLALAGLSERDREIVTLTAWEGLAPRKMQPSWGFRQTWCGSGSTGHVETCGLSWTRRGNRRRLRQPVVLRKSDRSCV